MTEEMISVIMSSYNYGQYIKEAIDSVINQTFTNWELIIIDDASSDNSMKIIHKYLHKDSRIKLIINEKNLGLAKTLQKGINLAEGHWIAFLESDDIFSPASLEKKIEAAKQGADIIFTDVELFQDEEMSELLQKSFDERNKYIINLDKSMFIRNFKDVIYKSNIIPTFSSVMVKKELLANCRFNPLCPSALDYYLWAQLCFKKVYYINEKLTRWRLHKDSYINKNNTSWFRKLLFSISIYRETIKDKNIFIRNLKLINYIRGRFIYFTFKHKKLKISFFNNKYVVEN